MAGGATSRAKPLVAFRPQSPTRAWERSYQRHFRAAGTNGYACALLFSPVFGITSAFRFRLSRSPPLLCSPHALIASLLRFLAASRPLARSAPSPRSPLLLAPFLIRCLGWLAFRPP